MSSSARSPDLPILTRAPSPVMRMLERVSAHSHLLLKIRPENEGAPRSPFLRSRQLVVLICLAAWSSGDLAGVRNLLILDIFGP